MGSLPEQRLVTERTRAITALERSVTSHYHGSTISGSEQSFLTEMAISIVKQWRKSMGYCFVLNLQSCTGKSYVPIFCHICRTTVCWDPEMLLPWQHEILSSPFYWTSLIMLLCKNLVMVWKRQVAISHWVPQKHSSEDNRQIADRNAVYFIVYFQRFHIIILIII